jgi:Na+/citrate or Na+/malate symporter
VAKQEPAAIPAIGIVLFVLALVATVVCVDVFFFRHHFTARLIANIAIVVVFGGVYLAVGWWASRRRQG